MARPKSIQQAVPGLWRILRFFWPWIREERGSVARALLLLFAAVLLGMAEPWPLKFVLDRLIPTQRPAGLDPLPRAAALDPLTLALLAALAVVAIGGLRALCEYHQQLGLARIGNRVLRQVRNHVFLHVQGLSLGFHARSRGGDLILRVTRDVSLLRDVISTAVFPQLASLAILAGMLTVMLVLEWRLALVALATLPLFWLTTTRIGQGIQRAARKQRKREGAMAATAAESITAIREVQALSLEDAFAEDFASQNAMSQKEDLKGARLSAKLGRTVDVLLALATALVLWYGTVLVLRARLTPGDLVVFLAYLKRGLQPLRDYAKYTARLAKASAAGERVLGLLAQIPEVSDRPGAIRAPGLRGEVRFDRVCFSYEPGHPVLTGVDLHVRPGQTVAVTGPSGGGKSTLVALLPRLFDPEQGRVLIDGADVRDYTVASLRSQVSIVLQDSLLFATSVGENIACGVPDATPEQVATAARLARASEFIDNLPRGFDTPVGERGVTLSRGQRQRIAIARAALRRAPILILDEPTTGLDEVNEREVSSALQELMRGMTTFLVTHDFKLADRADLVVYLEAGRIVECGSPAELLARGGRYRRLHDLQSTWEPSSHGG